MYKLAILKGDKESSSVIDRALGIIKSSVNDSTAFEVTELPFGVNAVLFHLMNRYQTRRFAN